MGAGGEGREAEDKGVEGGGQPGDIVVGGARGRGGAVVVVGVEVVVEVNDRGRREGG